METSPSVQFPTAISSIEAFDDHSGMRVLFITTEMPVFWASSNATSAEDDFVFLQESEGVPDVLSPKITKDEDLRTEVDDFLEQLEGKL